jgi:putative phage-type endonuclease
MSERDGWLEWRRGGIGASDVAAILGISPWASPWSVWADKCGLLPPEPENEYMTAGRWLEAAIGPWFSHETGLFVAGEQTWCTHREHEHHRCTVDGFVFENPGGILEFDQTLTDEQVAEFKRRYEAGARGWSILLPDPPRLSINDDAIGCFEVKVMGPGKRWDELPAYYQAQGQWQMHVTAQSHVWFAVLMGRRLDIHELKRDQADIELMVERVDAFWANHVLTGLAPEADASDATARALAAVYPLEQPGTTAAIDDELHDLWLYAKADKKRAETDEKRWANAIRAQLGEAEIGTIDGEQRLTYRAQTRKTTCKHCHYIDESDPFRVLRPTKPKEKR